MKRVSRELILLIPLLIAAAYLRLYGLDWDRGYLFHPDERRILVVASGLGLPKSLPEFFSPDSPLNPKFFAYGSFPIYLVKALSGLSPTVSDPVLWADASLQGLALLGRAISGLFDLGTIAMTFLIGRRLYNARVGFLAAACLCVTVLDIQLSHFYAVDTLLTFFVVATMFLAARFAESPSRLNRALMAGTFGLAMATKITAAPLVVPVALAVVLAERKAKSVEEKPHPFTLKGTLSHWLGPVWEARSALLRILVVAFAVFVVVQPYTILDPVQYIGQTATESMVARGWLDYPYTRQFAGTIPFAYQIAQSATWGIGLPLGVLAWLGGAAFLWQTWRKREWAGVLILSWAAVYFVFVGFQYTKYLRYLLPLVPFLYLMMAAVVLRIRHRLSRLLISGLAAAAILAAFVYSLAFVSIYSRDHPWIQISDWLYSHVQANSHIAVEHWDQGLPVSIRRAGVPLEPTRFQIQVLPMYDTDDAQKTQALVDALASNNYLILASQRLYATVARMPARYPVSSRYYERLFDGQLGFELSAFARNDPEIAGLKLADDPLRPVGLTAPPLLVSYWGSAGVLDWGAADESYAVYDHPMPLVFRKTLHLSKEQLYLLLTSP